MTISQYLFLLLLPLFPDTFSLHFFFPQSSLKEFTNLYNNLHFPNFKNVPPCIVILLKDMVYETENYEYQTNFNKNEEISRINSSINKDQGKGSTITENRSETKQTTTMSNAGLTKNGENNLNVIQNTVEVVKGTLAIPVGCIELPTCTVCLRRLQCSVSGIDGGNDIPVSIRFYGNTTRCQACRVYGECNESDGSGHNKTNSQVLSLRNSLADFSSSLSYSTFFHSAPYFPILY